MNYTGPSAISGGILPGVTVPFVGFTVGDVQADTPPAGQGFLTVGSLQGQSFVDKELLVLRGGIQLLWDTSGTVNNLRRYNLGGLGGWTFEGGLVFNNGEQYQIFIIGINTTVQV